VPFFNPIARRWLSAGLPMGFNALLTVRGRKTGRPRTTPITIIQTSGRRWVMAPFGEADWVRNLRAARRATITVRRHSEDVTAIELTPTEAVTFFRDVLAPLVRHVGWLAMWIVRNVDGVDIDQPEAAAQGRPVFALHANSPEGGRPMLQLTEMDRTVTLAQQLEDSGGPVILVNKFDVPPDDVDRFIAAWTQDAQYFKQQPGYISAQLHRGIAGSGVFLNVAVWESVEHFRRAQAGFRPDAPPNVVASPHLFRKVAVPNICVT
jgi:deazaflavin-dependent oxidoreductase (nitroreductase family)